VKISSVDIGTNTVLLLVAEVMDDSVRILAEKQQMPRLGRGVDRDGMLSAGSIQRVIDSLNALQTFLETEFPDAAPPIVTATSAVRDAGNRDDFIALVKEQVGWPVRLLSGREEAQLTYRGAQSVLNIDPSKTYAVLDIGGGSTEIATGKGGLLENAESLDVGSVRFSERYLRDDPPIPAQIGEARQAIDRAMFPTELAAGIDIVIGVAGTVTSIAAIDQGMKTYNPEQLNGAILTAEKITQFLEEFSTTASGALEAQYPQFLKGRSDVILAGVLILDGFLKKTGVETVTVSTGGIRHGVLMEQINPAGQNAVRLAYDIHKDLFFE